MLSRPDFCVLRRLLWFIPKSQRGPLEFATNIISMGTLAHEERRLWVAFPSPNPSRTLARYIQSSGGGSESGLTFYAYKARIDVLPALVLVAMDGDDVAADV